MAQTPAVALAPYLFYEDVAGAARFLQAAFGFTLGFTSPDPEGGLAHAQLVQARSVGAKVLLEPADQPWGDRMYCATDPEGQFWMFAQRLATK